MEPPYKNDKETITEETRRRKRFDTFALRKKSTDSQYIMSLDDNCPYRIVRRGLDVTPKTFDLPGVTYSSRHEINDWMDKFTDLAAQIYHSEEESDKESYILDLNDFVEITKDVNPVERFDLWYSKDELAEWELTQENNVHKAPSMFHLRGDPPRPPAVPQEIFSTRLQESPTLDLCDLPTRLVKAGGEEERKHQELRELQIGKRTKFALQIRVPYSEHFTQTFEKPTVDNWCQFSMPRRENASTDVYVYDRKRTFLELGIYDVSNRRRTRVESFFESSCDTDRYRRDNEVNMFDEFYEQKESKYDETWLESLDFFKGITLMERILSCNLSLQLQLLYHERLYSPEPIGNFKYVPQLLWVVSSPKVYGKAVTSISWNPKISDIFAVSYGKYLLSTETNGVMCIWNIKNTENPERMSIFEEPTTYVEFSQRSPRVLSVAFWNGSVALLDGVMREPEILVKCETELGSLLPVYQFKWFQLDDSEALVSCGENGEIHIFKQNLKFRHKMIMKLRSLGKTVNVGAEASQKRPINDSSPIGPAATIMCQHPTVNYIYLVGCDSGLVYICSIFRCNRHMGVFVAHGSAVTSIQFNPVEKRLLLTAGCDFYIRIWVYGHFDTYLMQFKYRLAYIDHAVWNPVHPYMIVAAVKHYIEVWHIKESPYDPISVIENPYKNRNLVVSFNPTGANFMVGDIKGYVFIYSFSSIPKPPKDPLNKLAEAIRYALEFDKERLKLLECSLGEPFTSDKTKQD